jgi:hypothetical protein
MDVKVYTVNNNHGKFDDDEWRSRSLVACRVYRVVMRDGSVQYAWSPDGVGCYWYDTLAELREQHL